MPRREAERIHLQKCEQLIPRDVKKIKPSWFKDSRRWTSDEWSVEIYVCFKPSEIKMI